jgi:hypothetical protein
MSKTYQHDQVVYQAKGPRWTFEVPNVYSFATPTMPGGRPTADKVARIINGALKRTKGQGMDNLARSNMNDVFHRARQTANNLVNH